MSRETARLNHVVWLAVTASGLALAWTAWCATDDDPFAVANHPWQPTAATVHILAAPVFVFAVGVLWPTHVVEKLRSREPARRRSGLLLVVSTIAAIASGYGLQVATGDFARALLGWLHGTAGTALAFVYPLHQVLPRVAARRAGRPAPGTDLVRRGALQRPSR